MFHNISNPKWFGNWSRLEDDYLGNGGTDIADNFTFSKMEKTGGLFGSIIRLATAFPACDPETGHATGAWKVACESIDLDEVPLSDIADMISGFDCETITDFRLFNTGAFDNTPWQQALGELLLRLRVEKDDYQWSLQRLRETGKLFSSQDAADAAASPLSGHRKRPGTRCASQTSIVWGQHRKSRPR